MLLTKEFLRACDSCAEGYRFVLEHGLIGLDYDEAIAALAAKGRLDFAAWLEEQKETELYVRQNGSVFTMGAFQIFNPVTGLHTRYETEEAMRAALVELANEILQQHCPAVVRELSNEHGDKTWVATDIHKSLRVE